VSASMKDRVLRRVESGEGVVEGLTCGCLKKGMYLLRMTMSLKRVFVSMWWVMTWRVYWINMMSWSVPRKVLSHFTSRSRNCDGPNKVEVIVVGSAGGEEFIGGGIATWDDSPVVAIFLVFRGEEDEEGEENDWEGERGNTDQRRHELSHAKIRKNLWVGLGEVIPGIARKVVGLLELPQHFHFGTQKIFWSRIQGILFKSSFLSFNRVIYSFASHSSHNVDLHVSPSVFNTC
jgi:hypothetical protein